MLSFIIAAPCKERANLLVLSVLARSKMENNSSQTHDRLATRADDNSSHALDPLSPWERVREREKTAIVPHLRNVFTTSFPSGHAMESAIVYLTIGAILMRVAEDRRVNVPKSHWLVEPGRRLKLAGPMKSGGVKLKSKP